MPQESFSFPITTSCEKILASFVYPALEQIALEIENMNIKPSGAQKPNMKFGGCKTDKALRRYCILEGFLIGEVHCLRCGVTYDLIFNPSELKRAVPKRIKKITLPRQPCHKCGRNGINLRILRK